MKVKEYPYFDRPREKILLKGVNALNDEELMMVILGSGVHGSDVSTIAKKVVVFFKSRVLKNADIEINIKELQNIKGVGIARASQIVASFVFFQRLTAKNEVQITSAHDVFIAVDFLTKKSQEHLVVLNLDGRNSLISKRVVTIGLLDQSLVHPREVYYNAINERAASIILVHNHPSGNLEPSIDDIKTTDTIKKSGEIIGIPLIDHVIVSKRGYFSFKEKGIL